MTLVEMWEVFFLQCRVHPGAVGILQKNECDYIEFRTVAVVRLIGTCLLGNTLRLYLLLFEPSNDLD